MTELLNIGLKKFNFISSKLTKNNLFEVKNKDICDNDYIRLSLENADSFNVDAVYFRFFENNRPPIAQIYIYDYTDKPFDKQHIYENNRRIWSSGQVPLVYVFTKTDIKIYNTFNKVKGGFKEYTIFEKIEIAGKIDFKIKDKRKKLFEHFTADNFDNGSFWEIQDYQKDFVASKSAYEKLLKDLIGIRKKIKNSKILADKIADKLLVMSIFVKYLEERKDENNNSVFPVGFFKKYNNKAKEFLDVFDDNKSIIKLFSDLSKHFNGEIFKLKENEENEILKNKKLFEFKIFLNEKIESDGQLTIWKIYSFNDLPIELISNIYEEFIEKKGKGVVYTPPFLVNFLLDQAIPLTGTKNNFKILDPACGSGIFLVQAYKRLIFRWRSKNNWEKPSKTILQNLLKKNIYGVDENEKAVLVAVFSLTLALCDQLSTKVIWEDLKFDNLKETNLIKSDFFKLVNNNKIDNDFDLVIGNPPFITDLTKDAKIVEKKRVNKNKCKLPESYALTYLFLDESMHLLNPNGNLCLIVPADTFLHKKESINFYKYFISNHNTPLIIDFTPLRRILFPSATVATIAIFANNNKSESDEILHLVTRRTKTTKEKTFFEIDKYDFFKISKKLSYIHRYIWKVNLFGGGFRHFDFTRKYLDKKLTFGKYLEIKQSENILSKRKNKFPVLAIKKNVGKEPLKNNIFQNVDDIRKDSNFKSENIIIYSNLENKDVLKLIQQKIQQEIDLYKFLILVTSDRAALSRSYSTILPRDIYNLPFTEENYSENLNETEKILLSDAINYYENFIRFGENSIILNKIEKKDIKIILTDFAEVFLKTLNSVYDDYLASDYIETKNHIIFPFYWGDKSRIPNNITDLENTLNNRKLSIVTLILLHRVTVNLFSTNILLF